MKSRVRIFAIIVMVLSLAMTPFVSNAEETADETPVESHVIGSISFSPTSYVFTGSYIEPTVTVKDTKGKVLDGSLYRLTFSNNIYVGTATVTAEGYGSTCTGSKSKSFTITAAPLQSISLYPYSYTYDGTARTPAVTVTGAEGTLRKDVDYTVRYSNNTKVGKAKVTVTGKGNYKGTLTEYFEIVGQNINNATITLDNNSYTYNGSAKKPKPTVTYGGRTLVNSTDYTYTYADNVNAGTAFVNVTGKGNYSGLCTTTFTINKAELGSVTVSPTSYTYDGSEKKPTATVKDKSGRTLKTTDGYSVVYSSNISPGTATVTATGNNNCTGTASATFTIKKASLGTLTLNQASFVYDGLAKEPGVVVKNSAGAELTRDKDYTVKYDKNINVGTAAVTVTGIGNCKGTKTASFRITPAGFSVPQTRPMPTEDFYYNGMAKTPSPVVVADFDKTRELEYGKDYTVSYSNNINAGEALITVKGKGNYTGTSTIGFTIYGRSLAEDMVTLKTVSYVYDGTAKSPSVTVKYGSKTLAKNTDYTVSYSNNINVGTATATVTGKGNYEGTINKQFKIEKTKLKTLTLATSTYTYDGTAKQPAVTVKDELGKTLTADVDYKLTYKDNIEPGTATVTAEAIGDNCTGSLSKTFTIKKAELGEVVLEYASCIYDGKEKTPKVTVKDKNGKVLTENTDYQLAYTNNIKVGTSKVTVTAKGHFTGTITKSFKIEKAALAEMKLAETSFPYDGKAKTPAVTVTDSEKKELKKDTDYTLKYENNTKTGTAKVTATGKGNYSGTLTQTFTITAGTAATITVKPTSYTYDGKAKTPTVTVKDAAGKTLKNKTDYTLTYSNNTNAGTATASIVAKGNYTGSLSASFTIEAATLKTITLKPTSFEYDGQEKKPAVTVKGSNSKVLTQNTDYTVVYADNIEAGTAKVTVTGIGNYKGTLTKNFTIGSIPQNIKVSVKKSTVKAKKLKKKAVKVSPIVITDAVVKAGFTKVSGSAKLKINSSSGKITVKKKTKKGTYTMLVKVRVEGTRDYKPAEQNVKVTIKVK